MTRKDALERLLIAGQGLSNCAYNMAQRETEPDSLTWACWRRTLREQREAWDAARREYGTRKPLAPPSAKRARAKKARR